MAPGKMFGWSIVSVLLLLAIALSVDDAVQRAFLSLFAATPLFYVVYDSGQRSKKITTRRSYLGLRKVTDDFLDQVRNLSRLRSLAQSGQESAEVEAMIGQAVQEMHSLIEQIRQVAGKTGPVSEVIQPGRPQAAAAGRGREASPSPESGR